MKDQIIAILKQIPPLCESAYMHAPFMLGLSVGYFAHPIIKLAMDLILQAARLVFKI